MEDRSQVKKRFEVMRLSHLYLVYLVTTLTTYHHTIYIIDRPNGTIDIEYKLRMIHILKNKCTLYLCLVFLQVAKCFVPIQILWVSPKIWLHLCSPSSKNQFYWIQIIFLSSTKCMWLPQNVDKIFVWQKKIGPAQNILGPLNGQGINNTRFGVKRFMSDFFAKSGVSCTT